VADAPLSAHDNSQHVLLERMLFFSDAVFAIVLTLLALELRLPPGVDDAHLLQVLAAMRSQLIAFTVSFAVVGVFWMAHLTTMRALAQFDWLVAAANLVFLFTITITPFVTTTVGMTGVLGAGWRLYCLTFVLISVAQAALLILCHRDETRLLHTAHHGRLAFRLVRASSPGVAFAIGFALSLAGQRPLSSFCRVLVPFVMLAARLLTPRRAAISTLESTSPYAADG